MAEPRVNGEKVNDDRQPPDRTSTDKIAQIKNLVGSLDEKDKQAAAAELVNDVLHDEAKMVVATEAMKTASSEVQQELITEAVKSADTVEAEKNVVTQAVRSADTVETKQAAAAEAVKSASDENKVKVATEGVEQLSATQQKELVDRLPITPVTADEIWRTVVGAFKWVLWGATLALVAAIGVALFREVDQALVQILLTVFTTVAGIFAGFIGGKALGGSTGG
jgi:hypothetical protein